MPNSVLEAIKMGIWDFEPQDLNKGKYSSTRSMPGTRTKLDVLADRVREGKPLWHPEDRADYDE